MEFLDMFRNMQLALAFLIALSLFIILIDTGVSQPPYTPPPPPAGYTTAVFALLILVLIWKSKSRGVKVGAIWGLVGLIAYVALMGLEIKTGFKVGKILLLVVKIIALPSVIWSEIAYQLGGGGSFYYNPVVVLLFSILIGALIGYAAEKICKKFKR